MPPKKKSVKKGPKVPKAPVGRPRKKLGTRVSDVPLVSTLRPRAARSNQDSMALQRARLQFKRDYPQETKGIDEYKTRALLDAMADTKRGAIGSRVLGPAQYELDILAKALLKAKKEKKKVVAIDGKTFVQKDATPLVVAGPPVKNQTAKTPKRPPSAQGKAPPSTDELNDKFNKAKQRAELVLEQVQQAEGNGDEMLAKELRVKAKRITALAQTALKKGTTARAEWEASQGPVAGPSGVTAEEKEEATELRNIEIALSGELAPEDRMTLLQRLRYLRRKLNIEPPQMTPTQTTQTLNLVNDVVANGITDEATRAIRAADPIVKEAVTTALGSMLVEEEEDERPSQAKRRKSKEQVSLSRDAEVANRLFDDMKQASDEDFARQLAAEAARQGYTLAPTEEQLRNQAANEDFERKQSRLTKKEIAEFSQGIASQLAREQEDVPLFNPRRQGPAAAAPPPPPPMPAAPPPPPPRPASAPGIRAPPRNERPSVQFTADDLVGVKLKKTETRPAPPRPGSAPSIGAIKTRLSELKKAETRPLLGPKVMNEDPLSLALQAKAEEIKKKMIQKAVQDQIKEEDAARALRDDQALVSPSRPISAQERLERALIRSAPPAPVRMHHRQPDGPVGSRVYDDAARKLQAALRRFGDRSRFANEREIDAAQDDVDVPGTIVRPDNRVVSARDPFIQGWEESFPSTNIPVPPQRDPFIQGWEEKFPSTNIPVPPPIPKRQYTQAYAKRLERAAKKEESDTELARIREVQRLAQEAADQEEAVARSSESRFNDTRPIASSSSGPSYEAAQYLRLSPEEQQAMLDNMTEEEQIELTKALSLKGRGLVGGRLDKTFIGGVLSRLHGMGYFDGFDSLMYNIHGTPDDNKKDLADAKAAYAARGGAMGGSIVLSGVPAPMRGGMSCGGGSPVLYEITFPVKDWKTSSSLRWLRSNGIKPLKKAMQSGSVYKYAIASSKGLKEPYTSELVSRGRKINMIYGMAQ